MCHVIERVGRASTHGAYLPLELLEPLLILLELPPKSHPRRLGLLSSGSLLAGDAFRAWSHREIEAGSGEIATCAEVDGVQVVRIDCNLLLQPPLLLEKASTLQLRRVRSLGVLTCKIKHAPLGVGAKARLALRGGDGRLSAHDRVGRRDRARREHPQLVVHTALVLLELQAPTRQLVRLLLKACQLALLLARELLLRRDRRHALRRPQLHLCLQFHLTLRRKLRLHELLLHLCLGTLPCQPLGGTVGCKLACALLRLFVLRLMLQLAHQIGDAKLLRARLERLQSRVQLPHLLLGKRRREVGGIVLTRGN